MTGTWYIKIILDWDYTTHQVHLSMPNYVQKALKQFQHTAGKLQHAPYLSVPIQYGCQEIICYVRIKSTSVRQQSQAVHPTAVRQVLIPWQSSRQHPSMPNQCHSIPIIKTNWRHDATNPTNLWLSSHAGRCHTLLPCKWYGVSGTQQCQLLKQAKSTKLGGRALLPVKNTTIPPNNGVVLNLAHIIKNIMSLATKAELAGLYIMACKALLKGQIVEPIEDLLLGSGPRCVACFHTSTMVMLFVL